MNSEKRQKLEEAGWVLPKVSEEKVGSTEEFLELTEEEKVALNKAVKKVDRVLEGLSILAKCYPDSDIDEINYDAIYFGEQLQVVDYQNGYAYYDLSNISTEDEKRLEQLGWFVNQDNDTWEMRL